MYKKIFFIAEIGINHNGSIEIAKKLIDEAVKAGFDAVKFQKRTISRVYKKKFLKSFRESPWGKTQYEQKIGLELKKKDYDEINSFCKKRKIKWFASAWDIDSLKFLDQYNLKYNKVASAMLRNKAFLEEAAKRKKYTFISTGMSNLEYIDRAVTIFKKHNAPFELMHCISIYPMNSEMANLSTIDFLRKRYKCKVGYSGHEVGLAVSFAAAMMGITSLERHITLDRSMYGSDQSSSLEKKGMIELISKIKAMHLAIGKPKIDLFKEESDNLKKLKEYSNNII